MIGVTFSLGDVHLFRGLIAFFPFIGEEVSGSAGLETQKRSEFLEDLHFNNQILQINHFFSLVIAFGIE